MGPRLKRPGPVATELTFEACHIFYEKQTITET